MNCGEAKQILMDVALDEAGADERRYAQAHLNECPSCRAHLADLQITRKLVAQGLPEEEMPRRIAFVAAPEPGAARRGFWRSLAFTVPLGVAAALALFVGALALAGTRLSVEKGRWEVAFGGAAGISPGAPRAAGQVAAAPTSASQPLFTREQAAELVAATVRQSEARQRAEATALIQAAAQRLDRRQLAVLGSLAEQMRNIEQTQKVFYKDAEGTRSALALVASRLPTDKGELR